MRSVCKCKKKKKKKKTNQRETDEFIFTFLIGTTGLLFFPPRVKTYFNCVNHFFFKLLQPVLFCGVRSRKHKIQNVHGERIRSPITTRYTSRTVKTNVLQGRKKRVPSMPCENCPLCPSSPNIMREVCVLYEIARSGDPIGFSRIIDR